MRLLLLALLIAALLGTTGWFPTAAQGSVRQGMEQGL
jgi:hypothetical protein